MYTNLLISVLTIFAIYFMTIYAYFNQFIVSISDMHAYKLQYQLYNAVFIINYYRIDTL